MDKEKSKDSKEPKEPVNVAYFEPVLGSVLASIPDLASWETSAFVPRGLAGHTFRIEGRLYEFRYGVFFGAEKYMTLGKFAWKSEPLRNLRGTRQEERWGTLVVYKYQKDGVDLILSLRIV